MVGEAAEATTGALRRVDDDAHRRMGFFDAEDSRERLGPKQKSCSIWRRDCGRCWNCWQDRWSEIWGALDRTDQLWVMDMYEALDIPRAAAFPSLLRWRLR